MKLVVQRVVEASATLREIGATRTIGPGLVILIGVAPGDTEREADWLAERVVNLRIFEDEAGKMNVSLLDIGGEALVVSQFTLMADMKKSGRRPSFSGAAAPEMADGLYRYFVGRLTALGVGVKTGEFGADMLVSIENDGPVTLILEREGV